MSATAVMEPQEQMVMDPAAQERERAVAAAAREIVEVEKMVADAMARLPGLHARLHAARVVLEGRGGG